MNTHIYKINLEGGTLPLGNNKPFDYRVLNRNNMLITIHKSQISKIKEKQEHENLCFQVLLRLNACLKPDRQLSSISKSLKLTGMLYCNCSKWRNYPFLLVAIYQEN